MLLLILTLLACLSAAAGVLTRAGALHRRLIPFSGGVLLGIAGFWVAPELSESFGALAGLALLSGSMLLVWLVDRFVYPLCPSCSPAHDHDHCHTPLHGFAPPLIAAAALHSFFDGWGLALAQQMGRDGIAAGLLTGIAVHKLPEGFSLGVILRAALPSKSRALTWAFLAELPMLLGGWAIAITGPYLQTRWMMAFLALAGASFLYLGYHAIHGDWRRNGTRSALLPAAAGLVAAGLVALLVRG